MSDDTPLEALGRVAFFAGLDPEAFASVAHAVTRRDVPVGTVLIAEGDPGDALYCVVRGRLVVEVRGDDGVVRRLGDICAGELVGEMAMLSSEPRSATVRALRASEVLELTRDAFELLCSKHPQLMRRLASVLANRLRERNAPKRSFEKLQSVVLIPHDPSVPMVAFAHQLHEALCWYDDWAIRDTAMQPGGQERSARERSAHAAIASLEHAGRHVLLVGTADDLEWNEIILTQADLILVVANADGDPRVSAIEGSISSELLSRRELVLLHEPGKEPSGTARWLGERTLARHHHLRRDDRAHTRRLARRLAGCSVGLVLGGGGARGFGHIGVLRAIAELGIPIDRVGGTSMGSIVGAEVALGWSWETMHERTRQAFRRDPMALDNTLPLVSKITCGRFVHLLQGLFGEAHAEDCWLPFFSVSSSLTDASVVTHKEGKLWQCLRASSALPGIGPPVIQSGGFLVDGAILNNLPANLLEEEGMGPVIAVNVNPKAELGTVWADNYHLSGWRILWERLLGRPGAWEYPSVIWVLQRTAVLASTDMAERMKTVASLYIHLPVGQFNMFKWKHIDRIVSVGYDFSKGLLADWAGAQGRIMAP